MTLLNGGCAAEVSLRTGQGTPAPGGGGAQTPPRGTTGRRMEQGMARAGMGTCPTLIAAQVK